MLNEPLLGVGAARFTCFRRCSDTSMTFRTVDFAMSAIMAIGVSSVTVRIVAMMRSVSSAVGRLQPQSLVLIGVFSWCEGLSLI